MNDNVTPEGDVVSQVTDDFHEHAVEIMGQLVEIDDKATAAGHSLAEILAVAAKNQFGIDVRPDDPGAVNADRD